MRNEIDRTDFVRFLKEESFIEWKLFPNDELDAYWHEFIKNHPEERKNILLAEKHFKSVNISSHMMPDNLRQEAVNRLEYSLRSYKKKRRIRRFAYTAAACVTALALTLLYTYKDINHSGKDKIVTADFIVGNELESEDILFITGNKTTSFKQNINIEIDGERKARVRSEKDGDKEITIEQHTMNKLIVPYGKQSEIILTDGTRAWLNSGSSLEFPSTFAGDLREVFLSGEMYVEVAPEKVRQFLVHTPGYDVKVYGTKFNVSTYAGSASSVVLVEGSVSLRSADKSELFISPEEQAIYSETTATFDTRKVNVHSFISWKEGYLTFIDTPVTEALKQIERYYNLSFNFDDDVSFQGRTCTGKIILSDNLDIVMTVLSLISATEYKRENKLIYIYNK